MRVEPLPSTGESSPDLNVGAVLERLAACVPFDMERTKGRWSKALGRSAVTANLIGLSLLPLFAMAGGLRYGLESGAGVLDGALLLVGMVLLPFAGLASLLCTMASDALHWVAMHKRRGSHWAAAYAHDSLNADDLLPFPLDALRAADTWFDQKIKRMERRQARFFGGNDRLALFTLIAAVWAVWKEVQGLVLGAEPSWLLWGLALLGGMMLGGLMVSRELEKMAYLRDLLALAIKRQEAAPTCRPTSTNAKSSESTPN